MAEDANVLILLELQSGKLVLNLIQYMGEAVLVGPVFMGTPLPAHLRQYGATVEEIVNLTAHGVVEASAVREQD